MFASLSCLPTYSLQHSQIKEGDCPQTHSLFARLPSLEVGRRKKGSSLWGSSHTWADFVAPSGENTFHKGCVSFLLEKEGNFQAWHGGCRLSFLHGRRNRAKQANLSSLILWMVFYSLPHTHTRRQAPRASLLISVLCLSNSIPAHLQFGEKKGEASLSGNGTHAHPPTSSSIPKTFNKNKTKHACPPHPTSHTHTLPPCPHTHTPAGWMVHLFSYLSNSGETDRNQTYLCHHLVRSLPLSLNMYL